MNKYLVAHVLDHDAKKYCEQISEELSEQFEVIDPHRRIPAHFTLKSPFRASEKQIEDLRRHMEKFSKNCGTGDINLNGFGHFRERVVYVSGTAEKKTRDIIDSLTTMIKDIGWIVMGKHDHDITLHTTLCRPDSDAQFEKIWSYLSSHYDPDITIEFDSISLLKLNEVTDEWSVSETFHLE